MHNIIWLNNTIPVICGGAFTTKEGLLNDYRHDFRLLARIDVEEGFYWEAAVMTHVGNPLMPPAQKLFWRTRLEPELVSWKRMSIFLPLLCTNLAPLSRWIPESNLPIMCSSTPGV
jgi:hypothetical protein